MKVQSLSIEIPSNSGAGVTLKNTNRVFEYLTAQGWRCSRTTVNRHAKAGKIQTNSAGEFPVSGVDAYAAMHFERIGDFSDDVTKESVGGAHDAPPTAGMEPGLDAALERLRAAEVSAFLEWKKGLEQGVPSNPVFRSYAQSIELLRKAERNLLDLQREQRILLPASEVKEWMVRQITASKSALLNVPGKLAPQLEGLPWPIIQQRLEDEINSALEKLSEDPCGVVAAVLETTGEPQPLEVGREASGVVE